MRHVLGISAAAVLAFLHACSLPSTDEYARGTDAAAPVAPAAPDAGASDAPADAPPSSDPYGDAVRSDGPAAWYRLDEAAGARTVKDETGAHPGTVEGTITLGVPGVSGSAAHFASGQGDISLGDVFDFAGLNEYTIELWATAEPTGNDLILIDKRASSDGMPGWILYVKGGGQNIVNYEFWETPLFQHADGALPATASHVVVSVRLAAGGEQSTMYIDGVAQSDTVGGNAGPDTTQPLTIGGFFAGTLDEVAFYTKALGQDRVQAHYRAGRP